MNDSKAGNSKLNSTKNATLYRIALSAVNQSDGIPILQNTRFSDSGHARTVLGIGCVFRRSTMHECFPNDAKQNSVMANDLWSLDWPKHHRLYAPYAFERLFNANSCSGNYQINTDVTGIVPNIKKPSAMAGFF